MYYEFLSFCFCFEKVASFVWSFCESFIFFCLFFTNTQIRIRLTRGAWASLSIRSFSGRARRLTSRATSSSRRRLRRAPTFQMRRETWSFSWRATIQTRESASQMLPSTSGSRTSASTERRRRESTTGTYSHSICPARKLIELSFHLA